MGFVGAEGHADAVGRVTGYMVRPYVGLTEARDLRVVDAAAPPPADAVRLLSFPKGSPPWR